MIFGFLIVIVGSFLYAWVISNDGYKKLIFALFWLSIVIVGLNVTATGDNELVMVAGLGIAVIIPVWMRIGSRSGYKLYFRTAFNKVAIDKVGVEEAILAGLDKISYRKPFSDLTAVNKQNLASLFSRFNDITVIKSLILESERKRSISPLINKEKIINMAKNLETKQGRRTQKLKKDNKYKNLFTKKNVLVIVFVSLICFGLYWFGIRVPNIKKECAQLADKYQRNATLHETYYGSGDYTINNSQDYITLYESCKAYRGL